MVDADQLSRLKRIESWLSLSGSSGFVLSMLSAPMGWTRTGKLFLGIAAICWVTSAIVGLTGLYQRRRSSMRGQAASL